VASARAKSKLKASNGAFCNKHSLKNNMGLRQRIWAKKKREELLVELGSRCVHCGKYAWELEKGQQLEFDCIEARGDAHHRGAASERMCFYRKQHKMGNIQILCSDCNCKKSLTESPYYENIDCL
jgi:hypothetical protein